MTKNFTRSQRVIQLIAHRYFFAGIVGLLVLQALWIALSGRFPMAFDEEFHLGIIRLYSEHISPFWSSQPVGADSMGAVFRDPSYLYHYVMSFPYRVVRLLTDSLTIQVISLRLINIALFASGLVVWRKLLLKTGASRSIVHSCLLAFVLVPVVPLLAAQINYDNLFFPIAALVLLLAASFGQELAAYQRVSTKRLLQLATLAQLASLVKYAFLPILIALGLYVLVCLRRSRLGLRKIMLSIAFGWTLMTRTLRWILVAGLVLATGLFAERYVVNTVRYHAPLPDCAVVLSERQCQAYGPWARNHSLTQQKNPSVEYSPITYVADWFYGMWLRSFFAVAGPSINFETRGPLTIPGVGVIVLAAMATIAALVSAPQLWRRYNHSVITLFVIVIVSYVGLLFVDGLQSFQQLGTTVAINGRYLLPVALPLILLGAMGINQVLKTPQLRLVFAGASIVILLWGGGSLTYILRSRAAWYWPSHKVVVVNQSVRNALGPLTPGYRHPTQFMSRN